MIVHESLSFFFLQQIQNTRSKVKNIDSSPLQNTCSNILLQLSLIYRTIHSAFGVILFGVIFILWFCIDPVLTVYSFHVKKKCLMLVITKNKRHKKMEIHRKMFLWSLGGANSPRGVSQVNWDHFGDCGELKIYPATKILTRVLKWWPTDLKKKGREREIYCSLFKLSNKQMHANSTRILIYSNLKWAGDQVELILLR